MLSALTLLFTGLFASDASAQTRRQIEQQRQRAERQNERQERRRGTDYQYGNDRDGNDRNGSRSAGLNNAVRMGYQQGLIAGEADRRKKKFNRSNVYRNTGTARNGGDPSTYDYLYRQGYLEGYEDGYYGRRRY